MPKRNSHFEGDDLRKDSGHLYFGSEKVREKLDDGTNTVTAAQARTHIDNSAYVNNATATILVPGFTLRGWR